MLVIGLQGSPKKSGSCDHLLKKFLMEIEKTGAEVQVLDIARMNIRPCIGCGFCEKEGFCVIDDDDMAGVVYKALRQAEVIVTASPVFFYSVTAQIKALIDRAQAFWSRKYRFRLSDPLSATRKGFLLSMGGSRGKKLFQGVHLVATYFFDAIDAAYSGSLTYPGIEIPDDFKNIPHLAQEVSEAAHALMSSLCHRKRIRFLGKHDDIRSQMAGALMQYHAGNRFCVETAGIDPAQEVHPAVTATMAEIGIDMAFCNPRKYDAETADEQAELIIAMGDDVEIPAESEARIRVWDLPDPHPATKDTVVRLREQIRDNINQMLILENADRRK